MAKHSHWSNIKHHKAANDARKGKVIAKMGKLIAVAVQMGGPSVRDNPRLRLAVEKARAAQMSGETIERAIKKAAGEASAKPMEAVVYEGYAAGGVAVVVEGLTDNRTRTAPEIKKLFERGGGSMGVPGCVSWQFRDRALAVVTAPGEDAVLEALLAADCDALDVTAEGEGQVAVVAEPRDLDRVRQVLAAAGFTVLSADLAKLPDNRVAVAPDKAQEVLGLLEALDDHDDVQEVHHNADL